MDKIDLNDCVRELLESEEANRIMADLLEEREWPEIDVRRLVPPEWTARLVGTEVVIKSRRFLITVEEIA